MTIMLVIMEAPTGVRPGHPAQRHPRRWHRLPVWLHRAVAETPEHEILGLPELLRTLSLRTAPDNQNENKTEIVCNKNINDNNSSSMMI